MRGCSGVERKVAFAATVARGTPRSVACKLMVACNVVVQERGLYESAYLQGVTIRQVKAGVYWSHRPVRQRVPTVCVGRLRRARVVASKKRAAVGDGGASSAMLPRDRPKMTRGGGAVR